MFNKKIIICFLFFGLCGGAITAQEIGDLTLEELLELSHERSLESFRTKRQYTLEYWRFRSFKASMLPSLDIELEPFNFNRSFVERYDADRNIDVFRRQQNITSFGRLSLNQNILLTGASVYVSSSFERLENHGQNRVQSYNAVPVRIGIVQPIMGFNGLKWQKKTAELELDKAKKAFIADQQKINKKGVALFFKWALANARVNIARENEKDATRLYKIGKKRYDLGSIEKDELLNLELEDFTSSTKLTHYEQNLETVIADLKLFLNVQHLPAEMPQLPEMISDLKISKEKALRLARENNPDLLESAIREIHADRDLDKAIKENRFDLSISASFGLNQQANHFGNAYRDFLDQQIVGVKFSMPILDWGERKGNIKTAKMTRELANIEIEQDKNDVIRQLKLSVNKFNLQEKQVLDALRARNIARESYEITEKRFLSGKLDLLRLTSARTAWQETSEQYIQNLQQYWEYYYEVQALTLYDFIHKKTLREDFDALLQTK